MLLFSTILDINESMTKENFIKLVIQWNQGSPHLENRIPDIVWHGEKNIRYGNDTLWIDIQEYRNQNVVAVRYEKIETDGVIWDTDYVMNFNEMRMAIQLYRSYKEEALTIDPSFSTPHFITLLINNNYLKTDGNLPVLRTPFFINESNIDILSNIINGTVKYRLPVVYVSKTVYNYNPVNVNWLSSRLKGVAHVLVEEEKSVSSLCRQLCKDKNEFNGAIGIYYPNPAIGHRRYLYRRFMGPDSTLLNKVVGLVIQYGNAQNIDNLYTWQGVSNSLLSDRLNSQRMELLNAEKARQKAENEVDMVYGEFDEDLNKLQRQIEELTRNNEALIFENQGLRAKINGINAIPILYLGEEDEFYEGEIKDMILSALDDALSKLKSKTRKSDVFKDIIKSNNYQHLSVERQKNIKNLLKGYKTLTSSMRKSFSEMGFEITEDGKHYKFTYFGDRRYWTTIAKTPGDSRDGKNAASVIIRDMF